VATLDAAMTLDPAGDEARTEGAKGATVLGRYVVLRTLGSGAMGTVYLAYDPELDRKIALKLLQGSNSPRRAQALLGEAQAMAKLSHPNVVAVHDVGEHEHAVYVAMEFVEGTTLRDWLTKERRSWRSVLEIFLEAGRGLEAAHERGLIHRDFKPDNVMVSESGRAMVMDFGLARPSGESYDDAAGTPAYMAPEQTVASALTPAADQFAFCVSLWEGLCGQRPFAGPTYPEMLRNISEGRVRAPPSDRRLPRWLKRCLLRGMRPDAEARWPSMRALLNALDRGRTRWRWQAAAGVAVVAALPVGAVFEQQRQVDRAHAARRAACETQSATILEVWNDDARQQLREGLRATGVGFADDSVETLRPWLDAYAQAWQQGHTQVCMRSDVAQDWTSEQADRAMWCFEDRRLQLEAAVEQISGADAKAARRAVRIASYLDPVQACLDPNLLDRLPAPPAKIRDAIRSIRRMLIESDHLRHGGHAAEALEQAREARVQAQRLGWPPLLASARMLEGRCLLESGLPTEASNALTDTYFEAADSGSIEVAFRAARSLVKAHTALQHYREAEVWARHADTIASDKVDPGGLDEAEGHYLLTEVYRGLGDYAAAAVEGERAIAKRAATLGEQHPITAAAQRSLALVYLDQGRANDALSLAERAYTTWKDAVGPEHPAVASLAMLRGQATFALGRPDDARPLLREALDIYEAALPEGHPTTAATMFALGRVHVALGHLDDAQDAFDRAAAMLVARLGGKHRAVATGLLHASQLDLARGHYDAAAEKCTAAEEILRAALDAGHPELARATETLADVLLHDGRLDDAVALRRSALTEREAAWGMRSRQLVVPLVRLGDAQQTAGNTKEADRVYARALSIAESLRPSDDALLVLPLAALAERAVDSGDGDNAATLARRAVRIADTENAGHSESARARFALARALALTGAPLAEVREVAHRARAAYETAHAAAAVARVEGWLERVSAE